MLNLYLSVWIYVVSHLSCTSCPSKRYGREDYRPKKTCRRMVTYLQQRQTAEQVKYSSGKKEYRVNLSSNSSPQKRSLNACREKGSWRRSQVNANNVQSFLWLSVTVIQFCFTVDLTLRLLVQKLTSRAWNTIPGCRGERVWVFFTWCLTASSSLL